MARCLRCHADSSWIEGNVKPACCDHEDRISELEAELDALRAAPPKIDGVPTVPGWYLARSSWRGWMCVEVRAELNGGELGFYGWGYVEEAQPLDLLKDYHGPLTPPKETT